MKEIIEKSRCTGCEACLNTCKHNAINMLQDEEGFKYPRINQSLCLDCKLCQSVCPVLQFEKMNAKRCSNNDIQKVYAAKTNNKKYREISSSGGIFPVIAEYILNRKGVVVGAAFDERYDVHHIVIENLEDLYRIQSSKYAQSSIRTIFEEVQKLLKSNRLVLFSGLACQIEGLKSFLRQEYDNLYTIDLICMGIPSPGVWRKYLDTFFNGEKIRHINFKDKTFGWRSFSLCIETDKRKFLQKGFDNVFFQCMFKTYSLRPSCFNCPFKKKERYSDFTLADCWGTVNEVPCLDDDKGLSSVIVHSQKGLDLWFELLDNLHMQEVTMESVMRNNDNLIINRSQNPKRKYFYMILNIAPKMAFKIFGTNPCETIFMRIITFARRIISKILKNEL